MVNRQMFAKRALPVVAIGLAAGVIAGCGGSGTSAGPGTTSAPGPQGGGAATSGSAVVLPVPKNPIVNHATAAGLTITKALVENNVAPDTGKAASDHLEVALANTTAKPLSGIALYYRISDPVKSVSEGYYAKLSGFTIAPGATRVAHFDGTGAPDHFPVNRYSLYYTDKNALVLDITASAPGLAPAAFSVRKDAGGAEAGVE